MNKTLFRLLVFLMSLSLIGIILVQLYLINTSFKNNEDQFKYHVKQVIGKVAEDLKQQETYSILNQYNILKDSIGKDPQKSQLLDFVLVQKNRVTNETIIYSNSIISEDYNINLSFFDKKKDSLKANSIVSNRKMLM
jgi:two-component system phosphate regulon sensor histidine kinase PhoR